MTEANRTKEKCCECARWRADGVAYFDLDCKCQCHRPSKQQCTCVETCKRRGNPFPADWSWQCQQLPYMQPWRSTAETGEKRAYYETHDPPHCPTCGCGIPPQFKLGEGHDCQHDRFKPGFTLEWLGSTPQLHANTHRFMCKFCREIFDLAIGDAQVTAVKANECKPGFTQACSSFGDDPDAPGCCSYCGQPREAHPQKGPV